MEKGKKQNIIIIILSVLIFLLLVFIIFILTGVINFNKTDAGSNRITEDDSLKNNNKETKDYIIVISNDVRIRDKASTKDGKIIGTVNKNDKIELVDLNEGSAGNGCLDDWYKVSYKDGGIGYICSQYAVEEKNYVNTDLKNEDKIKNNDIKKLLNYVRRTNSYNPNYLETSLSKMDGSSLLTIVINNIDSYEREKYIKEMTEKMKDNIISKNSYFTEIDKSGLLYHYLDYDSNKLFTRIKEVFNKDKSEIKFDFSKLYCFNYSYISNVDIIYRMENCGGPAAYYTEIVQSYEEKDGSVIVITEIDSIIDDVTDLEVDGMKLKYTFKKNSSGKYYVSEIEKYS